MPSIVRIGSSLTAVLTVATLAACGSDNTGPSATGSLTVTVTTPAGVTPAIAVSGPNAYSHMVAATGTLSNLKAGNYALVGDTVNVPDSVVGASINTGVVTGSPANVVAHETAQASVTYTQTGRRGGLWVANNNNGTSVTEFAASQLRASGTPTPADTIGGITSSGGVAIDASGNLWVADFDVDTLRMYTLAQRTGGGSPTPTITIVSPSLSDPEQIAFDSQGTLWVADDNNGLIGFTHAQLTASGTVTATYVITDTTTNAGTYAVAFDASGNAWVAGSNFNHLSKYTASQLTASGSPVPTVVIDDNAGSLQFPSALAFDAAGNLWVANDDANTVVQYTSAQLGANGSPVPAITLTLANNADPFGVAVDNRGTVWVSDDNNSTIIGIPASQLTTGTPASPIVIASSGAAIESPEQLVFDPFAPASAPVVGSRVPPRSAPRGARGVRRLNGAGAHKH
jgi:sugar lactone lactonase YvrE